MQTKHLYVLIHNWTKGEVGVRWKQFSWKTHNLTSLALQ